ncbi:MAG: efflux RND transporter permease subunit [Gammaproteobacteria bacterium]|nr:efflux RND transporter permease subunit [Gammaproteobacteria bacterium]MCP5136382.1 efflux RND transporter permease subunit [Gammaproteobacteria bacterium]
MNMGEYSVRTPVVAWLLVIFLVGGGIWGYQSIGKLEDPAFTIKTAKVITQYPGASAKDVQDEVTYHIEDALQRMEQVKHITMAISRPGVSDITVDFKDHYRGADFPIIYDELRRKIADVEAKLPPGARKPVIVDDFGDVYGIYLALHGEGYTYRDLYDTALEIKKQLVIVNGVRKVVIDGEQKEAVYLEISRARMAELGISPDVIRGILRTQNLVLDSGRVEVGDEYIRIHPTGELKTVKAIGDVLLASGEKRSLYLRDIAQIKRLYKSPAEKLFYVNGKPSMMLGISMNKGQNVIEVGDRVRARLDQLQDITPMGMELTTIYDQPVEVDKSVSGFLVSVGQAVAIVIAVLLLFMGLRVGLIIGAVLLITVAGTLLFMSLRDIELQRISLGALVIALGMLVDNAIVIAEGMLVRIRHGMPALPAAREVVTKTQWPLLGGTVIGILAFSAIGLSPDSTGEFTNSLFWVICISLLLSWITAISTTPLLCAWLLKPKKDHADDPEADPYAGLVFRGYKKLLAVALRFKVLTLAGVFVLFASALWGFGFVKQSFFPNSNTPIFFVDLWLPEGSDIRRTQADALKVSEFLRARPEVRRTNTVIGGGHQRFILVYSANPSTPVYAQIIVETDTREQIETVSAAVDEFIRTELPDVDPILKNLRLGPGRDGKIEARIQGPDATVLRGLAEQVMAIMRADDQAKEIRTDWRQPVKLVKPVFNEQVGRQLGISRENLANALAYASEGNKIGDFRDGIRVLPIYARAVEEERKDITNLHDILVYSPVIEAAVPISQVVSRFDTGWESPILRSRDRIQTITIQANPKGELSTPLFNRLRPKIEAMNLPHGYTLEWGGEFEDTKNAQGALFDALPMGFLFMILVSILLFGKVRQPLIIWLTVPLAVIGISAGLLLADGAFDFMSLLGALALIGLLIKNAIVLIEEIDQQIEEGKDIHTAILDASVSRMRPVLLAASTTIFGMIPLLPDVFFVNMALTIMGGLAFATVLTLVVVPVLYGLMFRASHEPG